MQTLRDLTATLAALVILSGAGDLLIAGEGVRRFARFACGLAMMLALLVPLLGLLNSV